MLLILAARSHCHRAFGIETYIDLLVWGAHCVFNQHATDSGVDYTSSFVSLFEQCLRCYLKRSFSPSWQNIISICFHASVLVADTGPWAACQAAGGHLARLMQTLSRGLRGTCCPSGGGEAWNETTPQQVTAQQHSVSKCADDNGQVWLSSQQKSFWASLLLIRHQIIIREAIQWASGTCVDTLEILESGWVSDAAVVWLLHWSNTHSKCDCVLRTSWCWRTRKQNLKLAHAGAHRVSSCLRSVFV